MSLHHGAVASAFPSASGVPPAPDWRRLGAPLRRSAPHAAQGRDMTSPAEPSQRRPAAFPAPAPGAGPAVPPPARPELLVIIDAEEEFEWTTFSPDAVSVENIRHQVRAQRVFERYGLRPSYVVDFPVASQPDGYLPLRELLDSGACDIGAQLHPWVNPPFVPKPFGPSSSGVRDSYPGNLARTAEHGKLECLTREIEANLGVRPTLYRAGRYGAGPNTRRILTELGYAIDCSVLPFTDLSRWSGPDYSDWDVTPSWLDLEHRLLELPVTSALTGALAGLGTGAYGRISQPVGRRLHLPGVFARLGLLERIKLTPEGTTLAEAQRLTRSLLARGQNTFVITYHSLEQQSWGPSLLERLSPDQLMERVSGAGGGVAGRAGVAVVSTFGALATFAIIVVLGVFLAADPGTYRAGIVMLVAPSGRERAEAVLRQLGRTLQGWLLAQFASMAVIGALIALGLWLLCVQLAVVLGVIAALLTFIPNLGPILAAAPALLLAFADGPTEALWVAALYVGVQVIEGNVTTPLIQQRTISLPPVLIMAAQLLMASLFGLLGLALATPMAAVGITLTQSLYVHGYLGSEPGRGPPT